MNFFDNGFHGFMVLFGNTKDVLYGYLNLYYLDLGVDAMKLHLFCIHGREFLIFEDNGYEPSLVSVIDMIPSAIGNFNFYHKWKRNLERRL